MDLFDLLTPEEKAQYAKALVPSTRQTIGQGMGGVADAITGAYGTRPTNYMGQGQSRIDMGIELNRGDMKGQITENLREVMKRRAEQQAETERQGTLGTIEQDYPNYFDKDIPKDDALAIWKAKKSAELASRVAGMRASSAKPDHFHERQATHLGDQLQKSGLIPVGESLDSMEKLLKGYTSTDKTGTMSEIPGADIPGFGTIEGTNIAPAFMRSRESRLLRQEAANLRNKVLQSVGGKNLTSNEVKVALDMIGTGAFKTEDQLINGINIIKKAYKADMDNFGRSVTPEARSLYENRPGAFYSSPQGDSNLSADEQAELDELERLYGDQ